MPDVKLTIKGKDLASGAVKGMTGNLIKAQLAVQGVMMAATKLIAIGKESVQAFANQEKIENKLNQTLKTTGIFTEALASEMQAYASELQQVYLLPS